MCNKKTPFETARQPERYLGISLARDTPDFYGEIYKALQREIKRLGKTEGTAGDEKDDSTGRRGFPEPPTPGGRCVGWHQSPRRTQRMIWILDSEHLGKIFFLAKGWAFMPAYYRHS